MASKTEKATDVLSAAFYNADPADRVDALFDALWAHLATLENHETPLPERNRALVSAFVLVAAYLGYERPDDGASSNSQ